MEELRYPVSTASFERIRTDNFVYVDKTEYVHSLVSTPGFYFLGRPRRFGKSLLISTIEAYYLGKRELFKGLAIDRLQPEGWEAYPVLHFDLSGKAYLDQGSLLSYLDMQLNKWEIKYGITNPRGAVDERFDILIETAAATTGKKVVILIDEYDSPLVHTIGKNELQEIYRTQLHGFYSVLKKSDINIQFCMLTGVTKFGKISVFSGLNNIRDISFENHYAGICGITEKELHSYFQDGVEALAEAEGWTIAETFYQLKFNYDGYHFSSNLLDVYNPYSVLNALVKQEISDFWCASGMPTLLLELLKNLDYDLEELNGTMASVQLLDNLSVYQTNPVSLFYQTGYLTIKDYDKSSRLYTLGYPNREVERGILADILKLYVPDNIDANATAILMRESLRKGNPEKFITRLKSFLSGVPSKLRTHIAKYENYYHTIFYCIASLIGLETHVEYNTSNGYIDILIKTDNYIYVIELKINGDAQSAIRQIDDKRYAAPFEADSRKVYEIGIGFSRETNSIESYIIKEI